jgi:hypothetical protein
MNFGLHRGFTHNLLPPGQAFPKLRPRFVPYTAATITIHPGNVDELLMVDTPTAVSIEIGRGFELGDSVHIAQWGASQVTVTTANGATLRYASTAKTRVIYSPINIILVNQMTNEWLICGDCE